MKYKKTKITLIVVGVWLLIGAILSNSENQNRNYNPKASSGNSISIKSYNSYNESVELALIRLWYNDLGEITRNSVHHIDYDVKFFRETETRIIVKANCNDGREIKDDLEFTKEFGKWTMRHN